MNNDTFKLVTDHPVTDYRCGARGGDQVRLKHDLPILDSRSRPTGQVHLAGELWTVLPGTTHEPVVVWLRQADGETHTWSDDQDFLTSFEIVRA